MRPTRTAITLSVGLAGLALVVAACIPPRGTPPVLTTTTTTLLTCGTHPASGVGSVTDTEDNDTFGQAQPLTLPSTFVGMEDNGPVPAANVDWAAFNVSGPGVVRYDLPVGNAAETLVQIVGPSPDTSTVRGTVTGTIGCFAVSASGTYYVVVRDQGGAAEQSYSARVSFTASP